MRAIILLVILAVIVLAFYLVSFIVKAGKTVPAENPVPTGQNQYRKIAMMDEDRFWSIIEESKRAAGDQPSKQCDNQAKALIGILTKLQAEEIQAYVLRFWDYYSKSYSTRLWAAAYLIQGGCSDDGFDYFRAWLVGQGKKVYDDAVADPDSLAWLDHDYIECEAILGAYDDAYKAKTGQELDLLALTEANEEPNQHAGAIAGRPAEEETWDPEDKEYNETHLPKLYKKFGS